MKLLVLVTAFLFSGLTMAHDHKGGNFEDHKKKVLGKIDKRIEAMQSHKTCISEAKDRKAIKDCRAKMKETRSDWKEERMERKKARKDKKGM